MLILKRATKQGSGNKVYMVDIDNTLADTWPSLKDRIYPAENQRYRTLSIFLGMRRYLLDVQEQNQVIFISARNYWTYGTTRRWLKDCGLKNCTLILVPGAMEKISFLLYLLKRDIPVVYIDDLSYNHEHGEVKMYDLMIPILNRLPITYMGLKEIEQINSNYEAHHQDSKKTIQTIPDYHFH